MLGTLSISTLSRKTRFDCSTALRSMLLAAMVWYGCRDDWWSVTHRVLWNGIVSGALGGASG